MKVERTILDTTEKNYWFWTLTERNLSVDKAAYGNGCVIQNIRKEKLQNIVRYK